jgi:hypothetical protein
MLKKLISIFVLFVSFEALACLHITGSVSIDGESWKLNSKIENNKEYIFPMGSFIFKMTMKDSTLRYVIQEKRQNTLVLVTQGEEQDIKKNVQKDIYAKGEEGQPHSIITIKLTKI